MIQANAQHIPLKDESVQMVCTSPPYWGLRNYGINGQLGLEETPEDFVENCVKWAREVWRVLRKDGTFWLNLGSSYASSDMSPSQSPLLSRVPACDNDGKEFLYSLMNDRAYSDSYDEPQDVNQNRHVDSSHNDQPLKQGDEQLLKKDHGNEHSDFSQESLDASSRVVQESTNFESFSQLGDVSGQEATASVSLSEKRKASHDVRQSSNKSACISDTSQKVPPLVVRTQGKESFFSACHSPDCKGIGKCGLCWCNLAIPSLNIKRKDLIDMPHLVTMALQADGWYKRSALPWLKRAAMPESCTDRPASALEYMFLLTKSSKYYFDMDAIRKKTGGEISWNEWEKADGRKSPSGNLESGVNVGFGSKKDSFTHPSGRNFRNTDLFYQSLEEPHGAIFCGDEMVGFDVNPQSFKDAHFATFAEKLVEPCIKAGTSEKGACPECGAPWERVVEKSYRNDTTKSGRPAKGNHIHNEKMVKGYAERTRLITKSIGWKPSCKCGHKETVPCIVLDNFGGSGTTENVADRLGRRGVMCELKMEYIEMAKKRCYQFPDLFH